MAGWTIGKMGKRPLMAGCLAGVLKTVDTIDSILKIKIRERFGLGLREIFKQVAGSLDRLPYSLY